MKIFGYSISLMLGFMFFILPARIVAQHCSPSPTSISNCGSNSSTRTFNASGTWSPSSCSGTTRGEGTWRYTAQYSGMHPIYVATISGSTTSSSTWCVYYKSGTSCNTSSWTYVGSRTSASTSAEAGSVFMEAGQSYLIGVDWRRSTPPTSTATVSIRVGCVSAPPAPCTGTQNMSSCGTTYTQNMSINSAWNGSTSGGCTSLGTTRGENTWSFTPQYSGNYPVYLASVSGSTTSSSYFNVYYRSGSCSNTTSGWTCIGYRSSASTSTPAGTVFLQAGTTYRFLVDWRRSTAPTVDATVGLRVGCYTPPNPCSNTPTLNICSSSTTTRSFSGFSGNNSYRSYCSGYGDGEEYVYRFRTGAAGNYVINVTSVSGSGLTGRYVNYMVKRSTTCSSSGWTCVGSRYSSGTLTMSNLSANTDYLLMLDARSEAGNSFSHTFRIECPDPCSNINTIASCGSTRSVSLSGPGSWSNSCPFSTPGAENVFRFTPSVTGTYYLRVTSASGGALSYYMKNSSTCSSSFWTCLGDASTSGSFFPVNLTANTTVLFMVDNSSTSTFSRNHTFVIDCPYDPCTNISTITCGSSNYLPLAAGPGGGWDVPSCSGMPTPGREQIYSFTPTVTGTYDFNVTSALGTIRYFYKNASLGCDNQNWSCIGSTSAPTTFQVNLTAGTPYYILADGASATSAAYHYFTVECTDPCQNYALIPSCGFTTSANMNASSGAGWSNPCGNHTGNGKERIFSFTPVQTDAYAIQVSAATGAATYYYRDITSGCTSGGWTCIDAMPSTGTTQTIALTGGVTYLILVDAEDSTIATSQSFEFTCAPHDPCAVNQPTIQCAQVQTQVFPNGNGAGWFPGDCGAPGLGFEYLFDFTPTANGDYSIIALNSTVSQASYYYRVYSSTCDASGFQCLSSLTGPGLVGTMNLTANTRYQILIVNDGTTGGRIDFEIQGSSLAPPDLFTGVNNGCTSIDLSWQAAQGATDYILDVSTDPNFASFFGPYNAASLGVVTSHSVTNLTAGVYYYFRIRANYPCGSGGDTIIDVRAGSPVNLVATSNSPLCDNQGDQLNLSATSLSPGPYSWVGPNGFSGSNQMESIQNITTVHAGDYTVTVSTTCGPLDEVVSVEVYGDPNSMPVYSNTPVCENADIELHGPLLQGASYYWEGPDGFTSALAEPVISGAQSIHEGVYTLYLNIPQCGTSGVLTHYVAVQGSSLSVSTSNDGPVCEGGNLQLSANFVSGATYAWTGPNGFNSSIQNPVINTVSLSNAGAYSLTISSGCGSASDVTQVQILPGITNPQVSDNSPVCTGGNLQLSATTHSGASYFWQGPNGFTSAVQNPVLLNVNSLSAGEYTLTLSLSGCGSSTLTLQSSVVSGPALTASSNSPVCAGTSSILNLSASTVSGGSYSWTGPNGFNSTQQNPSLSNVTTLMAGQYYVTVSNNCGSSTDSVTVQVLQGITSPSATSNAPICTGGALTLSASAHTGASYLWQGPGGYTASGQTVSRNGVNATDAGMYSVTITVVGCATVTQTTSVQILSTPTASAGSNGPVCAGNVLYLTTQFVSGATYNWTGPNGFNSTVQNPSVSNAQPIASGLYSLTVITPSCGTDSSVVQVEVGALINGISARANSPICQGSTLGLTGSNISGVTYLWNGPGGFTSNQHIAFIPGVTTNASGVYTLTANSPGCVPAVRTVSVSVTQPTMLTISSNSPVCQGNPLNLNVNTISGATYAWAGPNGFVSGSQNPIISNSAPIHSGEYTVTVTEPGCGAQSASVLVEVGAALNVVTAAANSPLCAGSNLLLSATNSTGVSLTWSGPNGFASTDAFPMISNVSASNSGIYTLIASSLGCGTVTRTVNVQITSPVSITAASNSPVCQGNALFLNAGTVSGATYLWDGPLGYQATAQNPARSNAQPTMSGIYTLTVTTGSCGALTTTTTVEVGSTFSGVAVSSNAPLCVGSNLNLSATDRSGFSFSWTGPNGFVSTLANPSVSNVQTTDAGVYAVVFQSPGCGSTSRSHTVSVLNAPVVVASNNGPLCQGNVVYLNATSVSGATYSWSGPNGYVSSAQNPALSNAQPMMSGVYSLTVTTQSCGTLTATTTVSIGASVNSATAVVNTPICSGADLNFTATPNTHYQYAWSGPSGFVSTISNPQILAAGVANSGAYAVVISSPGCGSITRSLNVTVNNAPPLLPGSNSPVCQGNVMYLSTNGIPGATYLWNGPLGFVSTAMNPGVSNMQDNKSGLYTLTVTTPGCGTLSATTMASVTPSLTGVQVSANTPVCVGSNLNLSASIRNNYSYSWTGPNGFTSTLAEPVIPNVTSANQGNYTVVFTAPGCGSSNRSRAVTVVDPSSVQALNSGPLCVGNAVYFTGRGPAGSTYSWAGPNAFVTNRQNPAISGIQLIHAGEYTLNVNVPGCGIVSTTTTLVVNTCRDKEEFEVPAEFGVVEAAEEGTSKQNHNLAVSDILPGLTVSPNPSDGSVLNLKWNGTLDANAEVKLSIYDISGKAVFQTTVNNLDVNAQEWNYSIKPAEILPKGVYQIRLQFGNQEQNVKWIVQ